MQLKTLLHKMQTAYRRVVGLPIPLVQASLADRIVQVREGSVREKPDYDDAWLLACALRSKRVFDVGSNLGQAALIMLLSPSVEHITLIEANPNALIFAAENLIRNSMVERARFVAAFADHMDSEERRLWTVETGAAGSMYPERTKSARKKNASIQVPTVKLDTLAKQHGIPDFVKLDVEGAEARALDGAVEIARSGGTRFLMEIHVIPGLTMIQHIHLILQWCGSVEYAAWYMQTHQKLPLNGIPDLRAHVLLQPKDWAYPDWLKVIPMFSPVETALKP